LFSKRRREKKKKEQINAERRQRLEEFARVSLEKNVYKKTITTDACFFSLLIGGIKRKRVVGMRAVCVVSNNVFSIYINNEIPKEYIQSE
jgi:hypothetical protein